MSYTLDVSTGQLLSPEGKPVADLHGLGTPEGRARAERMLAALNAAPGRAEALKRIGAVARYLAESGQATEDGVRALAAVVADLVQEVAK
jgi:hypothetical protein